MKFDVAKYHLMRVTKHPLSKQTIHDYYLQNQVWENVSFAEYLHVGITVTDDLDWGQHINNVTSKATKTLGFLHRNLILSPKETNAAAPIWNPHHQTEINRIEKVHRTAARLACRRWRNQSYVGEMLDELQLPELQERRQQASVTFFYKIHTNLVIFEKNRYLSKAGRGYRSTRSHPFQYHRPNAYMDRLKFSFFPRTAATWNGLTTEAVSAETADRFKSKM